MADRDPRVRVTRDIVYGTGVVGWSTICRERKLALDAYEPAGDAPPGGFPSIVLAFGGAFHRGSKEDDSFGSGEHRNTAMAEYARWFVEKGYVAFVIDYRLIPEDPDPGCTRVVGEPSALPRARMDEVRALLGLPPATGEMIWRGIEAAADDMAEAIRFVRAMVGRFRLDPERIAAGGWSAGARTALYAVLGERVPVRAVVALSGHMGMDDLRRYLAPGRDAPAVLFASAEFDLEYIRAKAGEVRDYVASLGGGHACVMLPGATHFYQRNALTVAPDGRTARLDDAIASFLDAKVASPERSTCGGAPTSVAFLEAFAEAWNRHDLEALMRFMASDCAFQTWTGPDAVGARHTGREKVRATFERAWIDFPDAQWLHARHFVAGDRGLSEWVFTGTRASDGERVEVHGCDVFTFREGKIALKDSFRKSRVGPVV